MDRIDRGILDMLKGNARITASEIGKKVNLSVPAVTDRIRKLEENHIITGYTVMLDRNKLNYKLLAFILVSLEQTDHTADFLRAIAQYDAVLEVHHIAGKYDYLLKVLVEDAHALEEFISGKLKRMDGVVASNTNIVLSSFKEQVNI